MNWHDRFLQQASWTQFTRHYLCAKANISKSKRILEVGCGTGVILNELDSAGYHKTFGIDIDRRHLDLAQKNLPLNLLVEGNAFHLPLKDKVFDITYCHYLLLWLTNPSQAITEMKRVTCSGGYVLILAEPDYGGRIDYPENLVHLANLQTKSLISQGADPYIGRKIRGLLSCAGLIEIETGVMGGEWNHIPDRSSRDLEWQVIRNDLNVEIDQSQLGAYQELDDLAWKNQSRILYVPTFYSIGRVP